MVSWRKRIKYVAVNKLHQDMAKTKRSFRRHLLTGNCIFVDIFVDERTFHYIIFWLFLVRVIKSPQGVTSKNVSFRRHLLTGKCIFVDILCRESVFHCTVGNHKLITVLNIFAAARDTRRYPRNIAFFFFNGWVISHSSFGFSFITFICQFSKTVTVHVKSVVIWGFWVGCAVVLNFEGRTLRRFSRKLSKTPLLFWFIFVLSYEICHSTRWFGTLRMSKILCLESGIRA